MTRRGILGAGTVLLTTSPARPTGPDGSSGGEGRILAWIGIDADEGGPVVFSPMVRADEAAQVTYQLKVIRIGTGGRTASTQGGRATLEPGRPKAVSTVMVNLNAGDAYIAELMVRSEAGQETVVVIASPPDARS